MPPMKPALAIAKGTAMTAEGAAKVKIRIPACLQVGLRFGVEARVSRIYPCLPPGHDSALHFFLDMLQSTVHGSKLQEREH